MRKKNTIRPRRMRQSSRRKQLKTLQPVAVKRAPEPEIKYSRIWP